MSQILRSTPSSGPGSGTVTVVNAGTNITITGNANVDPTVNFAGTMTYTAVSSSPYDAAVTDEFISVDCSGGAITVKLPNTQATGYFYFIKDRLGDAQTHNITVTTVGGSVTIDGQTSVTLATNYESIGVIFNGTNYETY